MEIKFENKLYKFRSDFFTKVDPIIENGIEALEDIHQTGTHSLAAI